jgi:hypothetical protein
MNLNAVVARKGDEDGGDIVIKVNMGGGNFRVFHQVRDSQSQLAWLSATGTDPVPESSADAVIAKAIEMDWDLWVVEIDDKAGAVSVLDNILKG